MEHLIASSDLWPDITAESDAGLELTYPVGLELTYDFDPTSRSLAVSIAGLPPGNNPADRMSWKYLYFQTKEAAVVEVYVTNLETARELASKLELSGTVCAFQLREHLESMAKALHAFIETAFVSTPAPLTAPTTPKVDAMTMIAEQPPKVLITVDRDVSRVFGKPEGTCTMEYSLINGPRAFCGIIVATMHGEFTQVKRIEIMKPTDIQVCNELNGDGIPHELASFFGDSDSRKVALISAVLKLSFVMNTGLAKTHRWDMPAPTAKVTSGAPPPETVALPAIKPKRREKFTIFSGGEYREVPS